MPTRCASRIAFLQALLFSLLILNYYSASVVSNRLRNKGEKMNDSLISLAKSNMKFAAEYTPYIRSFLQVITFTGRYIKREKKQGYLRVNKVFFNVAIFVCTYM